MKYARLGLLVFFIFLPVVQGSDYLFVFHGGTEASVYDAATLELAGSLTVGPGAIHAVGVDNLATPGSLQSIYIIRTESVLELEPDPPFEIRRTLSLVDAINRGEDSAVLTPDGTRLMLMVGRDLQLIQLAEDAEPVSQTVPMGGRVLDATILLNSSIALVAAEGTSQLRAVSLTTNPPQRLSSPLALPEEPFVVRTAPNGSAIYAASDGSLFQVGPRGASLTETLAIEEIPPSALLFDPAPPVDTGFLNLGSSILLFALRERELAGDFAPLLPGETIREALTPGQDRLYLMTESQFLRAVPDSGSLTALLDPRTGQPFLLPPVDMEVGIERNDLFLAFGGVVGSVVKLTANGAFFQADLVPPSTPSGIALVSTRGVTPATLEIYGGNHQIPLMTGELNSPLAVRVLDEEGRPVMGEAVTFTTAAFNTEFDPDTAITNRDGVALSFVRVPVNEPFQITATLDSTADTVVFDVNRGSQDEEALNKISGDYQVVLGGDPLTLPLEVQALADGFPVPDLDLTSDDLGTNIVCDAMQTTDAEGKAEFTCTAPAVAVNRSLQVQITDEFGRSLSEPFEVTAVPTMQELPATLRLLSDKNLTGVAGQTLPDALRLDTVDTNGRLFERAGIQFTTEDDVSIHPALAVVRPGGALADVTFGCTLGTGAITATLNSPALFEEEITFTTAKGPPASLTKTQGDFQTANAGQLLNGPRQGLIAVVSDACGHPLASLPVQWEVNPPGAATLQSQFDTSNGFGQIFATVRLGNEPGPVDVTARIDSVTTTFRLFVSTIPTRMMILNGDGQTIEVGQQAPLPLLVQLLDEQGQPAPTSNVTFRVTQGSAMLSDEMLATDVQGQAAVSLVAGSQPGLVQVEVRAGDLSTVFNLNVIGRMPMAEAAAFVNGGSFEQGWAPGGAGSIFGSGFSEVQGVVQADTFPFPTELRGVRVLVNGVPAPILALANVNGTEQINIQVPFETPAPSDGIEVTIDNNGASTTFAGIPTFPVQPGIFELDLPDGRFAAALHLDFTLVDSANPARPGETVILFLTGMGGTDPFLGTNVAGPVPPAETIETPTVTVAGIDAAVLGSFYAPNLVTAYQINFVVPDNVPEGALSVAVTAGGVRSQEAVLPVAP